MPKMAAVRDGDWDLLSHDPETGVTRWIMEDPEVPFRVIVRTDTPKSNVEGLLERNKRLYNESEGKRWGDGQVAYSMPVDEFFRSGVAEAKKQTDTPWLKRFFNDPDNRAFRTFKGRL